MEVDGSVGIRVEFKPLLSSANIIFIFSKEFVCLSSRLVVEKNVVSVEAPDLHVQFALENVQLKPNSCRGLRWIGPQELQLTLEAEWVPAPPSGGGGDADCQEEKFDQQPHMNQEQLVSRIKACQSKCYCVGCGAHIFKPTCVFKRVLPLPSENSSDFADIWFCHNHHSGDTGHSHSHAPAEPMEAEQRELRPRPDDCLVSGLYLLVSAGLVNSSAVNVVTDKLICRRCGNFLGFVKKDKSSTSGKSSNISDVYKIYLHAICFRPERNKDLIPKPLIPDSLGTGQETSLLSEHSIESFLCHLLRDQSHRFTSFRFIIDTNLQFEGQSGVTILLWLLDQDLVVFSSSSSKKASSSNLKSSSTCKNSRHSCNSFKSMKLLYKAEFIQMNGCVSSHIPDVFRCWCKDNTVHSISLPYPLCKQLLSLLITSTRKLPRSQRTLNSFHVGYLGSS